MTFALGPALLFCPADRPDRYAKALERADAVILDLEDAVAPGAKAAAREALADRATALDPARVIVRVNPAGTTTCDLDLEALAKTSYRRVMVAKAEDPRGLDALDGFEVIALCETARGVAAAEALAAHPSVVALMWGAEDLVASMGGTSSRDAKGQYRDVARHARARVLLAAAAHDRAAIDAVYLDIADRAGLQDEAMDAAASGFTATACIHPSQVETIRAAFAPSPDAIARASRLLDAAARAGTGVFVFDGLMVDSPLLRHAEATLRRAGVLGPTR
ncbi:MAG TPA: CoA ester lyase [Microbacteriaceae bacterium]|jgi:citrate lyase subunit beta/citryl-CoA lyase|nr:CoA ester lyase [Microbacteriaceae bacterium]HQX35596.1 CoA ester lyase [Microbacteriaceae bacterium]HQZ48453.1 CoA ester lyase [Microbacteriaceae bacterium]HRA08690.1 CoA ester lyase [Microbacteriaceae bacterium]